MRFEKILSIIGLSALSYAACPPELGTCGDACYNPEEYTCSDNFLCPVGMKNCSGACYSPSIYHCNNGSLESGPETIEPTTTSVEPTVTSVEPTVTSVEPTKTSVKTVPTTSSKPKPKPSKVCKPKPHKPSKSVPKSAPKTVPSTKSAPAPKSVPATKSAPAPKSVPPTKSITITKSVTVTKSVPATKPVPPTTINPSTTIKPSEPTTPSTPDVDYEGYKLVFSDEFDGTSLDRDKWTPEVNCWGGGNAEKQCYVDHPETIFVEDGKLHIKAIYKGAYQLHGSDQCTLNNENSCSWTQPFISGRINTKANNLAWKYAKVRVRALLPSGKFLWPAIWMLPQDDVYGTWAASGEIDIMEARGQVPDIVSSAMHFGGQWPNNIFETKETTIKNVGNEWHVYGMDWDEDSVIFSVDDKPYYTVDLNRSFYSGNGENPYTANRQPFDQKFHILLNVAVGGGFFSEDLYGKFNPESDSSTWTRSEMAVDYVRVYQKA